MSGNLFAELVDSCTVLYCIHYSQLWIMGLSYWRLFAIISNFWRITILWIFPSVIWKWDWIATEEKKMKKEKKLRKDCFSNQNWLVFFGSVSLVYGYGSIYYIRLVRCVENEFILGNDTKSVEFGSCQILWSRKMRYVSSLNQMSFCFPQHFLPNAHFALAPVLYCESVSFWFSRPIVQWNTLFNKLNVECPHRSKWFSVVLVSRTEVEYKNQNETTEFEIKDVWWETNFAKWKDEHEGHWFQNLFQSKFNW